MLFKNAVIFQPDGQFRRGGLQVENGLIARLTGPDEPGQGVDLGGAAVLPGLVECHSHGCAGADFSDGDGTGLAAMGRYYAAHGITSFAPTSMTLPYEALSAAFASAAAYRAAPPAGGARLLGIHMEGPYFSEKKKGAQNAAYLKLPDYEGFRALYEGCGGLIRIVDVAAELPGAAEFTRRASGLCRVSVAHTDADYDEAAAVFDAGAAHLTHLFNAMPPIHHRKPGVIGAAAERENVRAELICDGLHVHPSAVRMAFRLFPGRICLISDSLRCCGMPDGEYELGGQRVILRERLATLPDGTIAGSATNLYECMRLAVSFGIPREEAVTAATLRPAEELGAADRVGSLAPGRAADFVVCAEDLSLRQVYMNGRPLTEAGI